jgi:GNAT superfamily N-acetyltransferase
MSEKLIRQGDPQDVSVIELGRDPYVDNLYGCFRCDNPKGDRFSTERDVEIVFRSGKIIKIKVPESLRIPLSADVKLPNTDLWHISEIGDNLDVMHLLTMRAGWNQNDRDIRRMVELDPQGTFVVHLEGKGFRFPVATASTLPLGKDNTWIGMILVHPELRRQGIANAMMQICLKYALDCGKIINGLDATPMGNTVYGAVGYVDSYRLWRSTFPPAQFAGKQYDKKRVFRMEAKDLPEVIRYDSARFLERERIMRALFADADGNCFIWRNDNGEVEGYCYTRPGRLRGFVGPFIADGELAAENLLTAAAQALAATGCESAFIDTPEAKFADPGNYDKKTLNQSDENKPKRHRLIKDLTPVRDFMRMYQCVDEKRAEVLVKDFMEKEKLSAADPRVREFRDTMYQSVANYSRTVGFMDYEKRVLQKNFWGITGPEKG